MIISHIIGGLGNQMFQYASGRSRSLELGTRLRLHVADFADYGLHQGFQLGAVFGADFQLASEQEVSAFLGWRAHRLCRRLLARRSAAAFRGAKFVGEPCFDYWPGILETASDCYLAGYWQSEKYFRNSEETIRADFAFKTPLTGRNTETAANIANSNAVSLHVRRGDYAANPRTLAVHGLCSADYYHSAIKFVAGHVESPEFFIFSDDIPWVKQHLSIAHPCHYIEHNKGEDSHNDMRLMSLCRHHIIANSSFSWWGAWLNPTPDKIVVAPRRWFADGCSVKDLIPEGWVSL
jgi:hypothetical protein